MHCISSVEHLFVYIKSRESKQISLRLVFTEHAVLGKRLSYQLKTIIRELLVLEVC